MTEKSIVEVDSLFSDARGTLDVDVLFDEAGDAIAGFRILDSNSDEYRKAKRENEIAGVMRGSARKKPIDLATESGAATALNLGNANTRKLALAITVDWYGFADKGKTLGFDRETLQRMLEARQSWADKIVAKAEEAASFLGRSPTL